MSLFNQLLKVDDAGKDQNQGNAGVGVHGFCAALRHWSDGLISRDDLELSKENGGLGIALADTDLTWLKAQYDASADQTAFIAKVEHLLTSGEARNFGLHFKANFVAAINAIG